MFDRSANLDEEPAERDPPKSTTSWFPKVMRKDYMVGLNLTPGGVDDPDQQFYENYACGEQRNFAGYCNPEVDRLIDWQSMESDQRKRKQLVWGSSADWWKTVPADHLLQPRRDLLANLISRE